MLGFLKSSIGEVGKNFDPSSFNTWLAIGSHLMVRKAAENSIYLIYDHKG